VTNAYPMQHMAHEEDPAIGGSPPDCRLSKPVVRGAGTVRPLQTLRSRTSCEDLSCGTTIKRNGLRSHRFRRST